MDCKWYICQRMCVYVSARVRVCVAVNSYGCYIWIVNDLTDCNTLFLFLSLFPFILE